MALIDLKVPLFSESVSEGTLLEWKRGSGEIVVQDEVLLEIETDKVVIEVSAPSSGRLLKINKKNGDKVFSQEVIAVIDTADVHSEPARASREFLSSELDTSDEFDVSPREKNFMPSARRVLEENSLSGAEVEGTGKGGRVLKEDVLAFLSKGVSVKQDEPHFSASFQKKGSLDRFEKRVPMSRLRQRVAERLLQSQSENAILTTFNEVDMSTVVKLRGIYREKFEKEHGVRLGFMSFFVKAVIYSLKKFPILNASVDGQEIVYHDYFDISIAVSSPRGLVVPVLRDADYMSMSAIEKKIFDYSTQAKVGKISIEDLSGGTFSISNGGVFGSMISTPIINPPQSAILGVHATKERPIVVDGEIVIRPMNYLALSYDHRIIDGREAVLALVAIKEALEDPVRLLLEI